MLQETFSPISGRYYSMWYVFHGLAGAFGDWSRDIHEKWNLQGESLPPQDKEKLSDQIQRAKEHAKNERNRKYEETAVIALEKWNSFSETGTSPYQSYDSRFFVFSVPF